MMTMARSTDAQTRSRARDLGVPFDGTPFFFQAEDGIRDGHVTGVQTCALPISPGRQAGYHIHSLDQLSVVVEDADQAGQELGGEPYAARRTPRGNVGFTPFSN